MAALVGISVKPQSSGGYTCKVPLDLLSQDGVPPEQGDSVSYSVQGTVQSVSGDNAVVKLDSIDGEPVAEEAGEGPSDSEAGEPDESASAPTSPAARSTRSTAA